jgi:diguanylate cyclase (GGDEF)-like protein
LDAWITLKGGRRFTCQIKDFSLGGVFVVCSGLRDDAGVPVVEQQQVELQFVAGPTGTEQHHLLTGRLARVFKGGFGIEFVGPDPGTLLVMQELANKVHQKFLKGRALEAAREKAAAGPSSEEVANRLGIVKRLKTLVNGFLEEKFEALFTDANERLFEFSKTAPSDRDETDCFDARREIDNIRSLVEQSFLEAVLDHVESPGYPKLAGPEARVQTDDELTLVDPDKFQDWLRIKRILEKAMPKYKDTQHELHARLSAVLNTKVDEFNSPIGPMEICGSFYESVQELGASRIARKALFDALEKFVVSDLRVLYDNVNGLLVNKGILPKVEAPKPVVPKTPRSADSERARTGQSQTGGHAVHAGAAPLPPPPPAAAVSAAVGSVGTGASPALSPVKSFVSALQSSPTGERPDVIPAPGHGALLSASAYQAVQTLLGLQRQADCAGGQPASNAPAGSASGAGTFATGAPRPSYAWNEITNALSSVRHLSATVGDGAAGGTSLKERIQSALEAQQPTGVNKALGEAANAAIDLTSGLVESIVDDVLVSDEIRSQFSRLEIPLLKAVMKNNQLFADPGHPARRVVDQLGRLTIPNDESGARLQKKVDEVLRQITSKEGDGESEFTDAVGQLEAVVKEQMEAYGKNVQEVVEECEQQVETTQSIRKEALAARMKAGGSEHETRQKVPEELRQWLERARRLRVGDRVIIDKAGRGHKEALAWVSSDQEKYVFVDAGGKKASSMIRQELAMLLKRGLLKVLAEASLPAMERGMHMILRKMHENLAQRAKQDETTGLLNRKAFLNRVNRAVNEVNQTSSEHVLCHLDLDHFGAIGEKWGETAADKLLERFGIVLKKNMGRKGVTARLLGDEFGLLLLGCTQAKGYEVADRLRRAVASARCYWKGETLPLSVSIGIVPITDQSGSVTALMGAAEAACAKAKDAGRDRVEVFQPDPDEVDAPSHTVDVAEMLEGDRLELRCQRVEPIGEAPDIKPHYEILLGIRNDEGDLISPESFIRVAERSNKIAQVDRWVIRTALQWMAKNKRRLLQLGGCSINLSGLSLNNESLTHYVIDQFMETKVPPGKVVFEVTETAAIERLSTAEEFLRVMKEFGCRFSLDDFGTGHSSYEYLRQLPVDFVKIDGMFVRELESNSSDYAMVKSITEIGHMMGKKTVAEFVENKAILDKVKEIGVDYAQGHAVGKPMLLRELS